MFYEHANGQVHVLRHVRKGSVPSVSVCVLGQSVYLCFYYRVVFWSNIIRF